MHRLPRSPLPFHFTAFQPFGLHRLISFLLAWQVVFVTGVCAPVFSDSRVFCSEADQPVESSDERELESEFSELSQLHSSRRGCERRWLWQFQLRGNILDKGYPSMMFVIVPGDWVDLIVIHGFRACRLC